MEIGRWMKKRYGSGIYVGLYLYCEERRQQCYTIIAAADQSSAFRSVLGKRHKNRGRDRQERGGMRSRGE